MPRRKTSSKRDFRDRRNPQDIARGLTGRGQRAPTREGPSFFDTMSQVGRQRAAQPPPRQNPYQQPLTPSRTPGVRPMQEGPSFAQTMGQVGQRSRRNQIQRGIDAFLNPFPVPMEHKQPGYQGEVQAFSDALLDPSPVPMGRNARDDAAIAGGYGYRNPNNTGVGLARSLGLNQMSPQAWENFVTNVSQNYPGAPPVSFPTSAPRSPMADPGSVSFRSRVSPTGNINPNAASLSVAPMLDVFRNDPEAMQALISGGGLHGYMPQFTGLQQSAYPWEPYSPMFGSMAQRQHDMGSWMGRGAWDPRVGYTVSGRAPWHMGETGQPSRHPWMPRNRL